jgi:hypothetical protein
LLHFGQFPASQSNPEMTSLIHKVCTFVCIFDSGFRLPTHRSSDRPPHPARSLSQLRTLTSAERAVLQRFLKALEASRERDPKYRIVRSLVLKQGWREVGCIIFSQYAAPGRWTRTSMAL